MVLKSTVAGGLLGTLIAIGAGVSLVYVFVDTAVG